MATAHTRIRWERLGRWALLQGAKSMYTCMYQAKTELLYWEEAGSGITNRLDSYVRLQSPSVAWPFFRAPSRVFFACLDKSSASMFRLAAFPKHTHAQMRAKTLNARVPDICVGLCHTLSIHPDHGS